MHLSREAKTLFNPKRFEIATILYLAGPQPMHKIREALGLTWGDLDSNLRLLQRHGLVELRKTITPQGPRTIARLTQKGKQAYEELVEYLKEKLQEIP